MILRIKELDVVGEYTLRLLFNNGVRKTVNVWPLLDGPIFEPLRKVDAFSQATLDPVCGTVVWPNGADLAPEALLELAAAPEPSHSGK